MKKIGIITIFDENNYGNRLQNYALQEVLRKKGFEVKTFKNITKCNNESNTIKKKIKNFLFLYLKRIQSFFKAKKRNKRYVNFKKFNTEHIDIYKHFITGNNAKRIEREFDYFIAGSDQIWNYEFRQLTDIDTLKFTTSTKKIAYAASLAVNEISEHKYIDIIRNNISDFKAISVREEKGKQIIEKITGRDDIQVLIDPTMLLASEEWDKVAKKPTFLQNNKKYILNYFLGDIPSQWKKEIDRIAKENNCEVINMLDSNSLFYNTGPSEFLYLEKNAFLVCTDSFHSCIFSILYNKPFIVFERTIKKTNMSSRLETLLKKFELEDRKFNGEITKEKLIANYKNVDKILKEERSKANAFLDDVLN